MIECCRKCLKIFCEKRNTIENCKECISEVYYQIKQLNKQVEE